MTKNGETNNYSVKDFVDQVEKLLKTDLDCAIYNNKKVTPARIKLYKEKHPELIEQVSFDNNKDYGKKVVGADVILPKGPMSHDSKKLIKLIFSKCKP
jgi:hypothetical protein